MQEIVTGEFGGVTAHYRPGTSDEAVMREVLVHKSYQKKSRGFDVEQGEEWLDLGANVGAFALYCRSRGALAVCYEPMPSCFEVLLQNAGDFRCEMAAVSDRPDGPVDFFVSKSAEKHHRGTMIKTHGSPPCREGALANLNGAFLRDLAFGGVKIDIEGSEGRLIDEWLLPRAEKMVMEYHTSRDTSMENLGRRLAALKGHYRNVVYPPEMDRMAAAGGHAKTWRDRLIFCWGLR